MNKFDLQAEAHVLVARVGTEPHATPTEAFHTHVRLIRTFLTTFSLLNGIADPQVCSSSHKDVHFC